jgi:hypothetical protein
MEYKKEDRLRCIKDYTNLFKSGNIYVISHEHFEYYDEKRNLRFQESERHHTHVLMWEDEVDKHFINLTARKRKLQKLNEKYKV